MSANLDQSLDDIISQNSRNRGSRNDRQKNRSTPYGRRNGGVEKTGAKGQQRGAQLHHAAQALMLNQAALLAANAPQVQQGGSQIQISNLDYGVTESDLRELFNQIGSVARATLNFDSKGKSRGTGTVTFKNAAHAIMAMERYHGVTLDGRPMKITVSYNPLTPAAAPLMMPAAMMPGPVIQQQNGARRAAGNKNQQQPSSAGRNTRKPRENKREKPAPVTKADLDAELDSYMMEADKTTAA
ncbi:hypothetical protein GGI07_001312 [Coemansia sp. Benny D115]|nr:hypothetical protein GGI07_001312 [Coemansia sp. Benny D115]